MREIIEVSRLGKEPSRIVIGDVVNSLENYLPEGKRVIVIADEHVYHTYRSIIGRYDYCLIGFYILRTDRIEQSLLHTPDIHTNQLLV